MVTSCTTVERLVFYSQLLLPWEAWDICKKDVISVGTYCMAISSKLRHSTLEGGFKRCRKARVHKFQEVPETFKIHKGLPCPGSIN